WLYLCDHNVYVFANSFSKRFEMTITKLWMSLTTYLTALFTLCLPCLSCSVDIWSSLFQKPLENVSKTEDKESLHEEDEEEKVKETELNKYLWNDMFIDSLKEVIDTRDDPMANNKNNN
ncbi:hypothetical protein RFI_35507, partial [Reticulomyxa filosa]